MYLLTEVIKMLECSLSRTMEDCLTLGQQHQAVKLLEDTVAGLVDGKYDSATLA